MADLATTDDLAAYLAIELPSAAQLTLLGRLLSAASAEFETLTGRNFLVATYTDEFTANGDAGRRYTPKREPLVSVSAVVVAGEALVAGGWTVSDGRVVLPDGRAFSGECSVTYSAGYAVIPADVTQAVIELAVWRYNARKAATTGGEAGFVPVLQMPASIRAAIDAYRAWGIA